MTLAQSLSIGAPEVVLAAGALVLLMIGVFRGNDSLKGLSWGAGMAGWARGRARGAWLASVTTGVDRKVWAAAGTAAAIRTARQATVRRVRGIRSSEQKGRRPPSRAGAATSRDG